MNKNVYFESNGDKLYGTLTLPNEDEKFAACLFICGSFPQVRAGDVDNSKVDWFPKPLPQRKIFTDESKILKDMGMASLRYDKRGCGESEGDFNSAGFFDVVEDARQAVQWLRHHPNIDETRVGVLGQSEGAIIALLLAAENPDIAFSVWQGGIYNNLEDILVWQAESFWKLDGEVIEQMKQNVPLMYWIYKQAEDLINSVHNGEEFFTLGDQNWSFKFNLQNFREHFGHPPSTFIEQIKCPVLLLHGELDHNTPPTEAEQAYQALLKAGHCNSTLQILSGLDHSFRRLGHPDEDFVTAMKRPLDMDMQEALTNWLKQLLMTDAVSNGRDGY